LQGLPQTLFPYKPQRNVPRNAFISPRFAISNLDDSSSSSDNSKAEQRTMYSNHTNVDMCSQILEPLEKFAANEYVITFGPDHKQFVGTPNGYLA
jgi:hypothetical protein